MEFVEHVQSRWCNTVKEKLRFWQELPHLILGMFAMYYGYDISKCTNIAVLLLGIWRDCADRTSLHRVALLLFTNEVLMRELVAFSTADTWLHHFPNLFIFVLRYALMLTVSHYLEGRHRQISLHSSGAASATTPGCVVVVYGLYMFYQLSVGFPFQTLRPRFWYTVHGPQSGTPRRARG